MEELPQRSWLVGCGRDCWWTAKASAVDSLYCGACHRWKQQLELQPAPYSFSFWCLRRVGFCAGRRRDRLAWRISLQGVSYKVIIYFFFIFFCRPNSPNSAYSFCVWSNASWRWDLSLNIVNSQRPACLHLSPPTASHFHLLSFLAMSSRREIAEEWKEWSKRDEWHPVRFKAKEWNR